MIAFDLIKQLRDRTGASLPECKKALVQSNGSLESAIESILRRNPKPEGALAHDSLQSQSTPVNGKSTSTEYIPVGWSGLTFEMTLERLNNEDVEPQLLKAIRMVGSVPQRRALALSRKTPHQLIQQLSTDTKDDVAFAARVGRKLPIELGRLGVDELCHALSRNTIDKKTLERISKYPNSRLLKALASNPEVGIAMLEDLRESHDLEVAETAFAELIKRGADPVSELVIRGPGVVLDVYEISRKQHDAILESDYVDQVLDIDELVDTGEYSYSNPEDPISNLYVNGRLRSLGHIDGMAEPLDDIGQKMIEDTRHKATDLGKCYLIMEWRNEGAWSHLIFKGEFDESKLLVERILVQIGNEKDGVALTLYKLNYSKSEVSANELATEGKGLATYLVDENGNVSIFNDSDDDEDDDED